jgi:succinylglutamate desuccinylase
MATHDSTPLGSVERELGRYSSGLSGHLLVITGGIHGNEPAGVHALRRVLATLAEIKPKMRGELLALSGNRAALAKDIRYIAEDLNRMWSEPRLGELRAADPATDDSDRREQRELLGAIERALSLPRERVIFVDLHSTSAGGPPFSLMGDTLQNRGIAFALGVPVLLGLEENVDGTLLEYFGNRGHIAVGLEAGQNRDPRTVDHAESAVWLVLVAAGLLEREQVPDYEFHRSRLATAGAGLPPVVEVLHRHGLENGEEFRMLPGLSNFQTVEKDRLLAHSGPSASRQVLAPFSGVLLMPRYQGQGNDGFFLGRDVRPFWLSLSAIMRRLRFEKIVGLLPGVKSTGAGASTLEVDARIARFCTVEFFHLLGYRKQVQRERDFLFTRRVEKPAQN